jgi:hypothetical protein
VILVYDYQMELTKNPGRRLKQVGQLKVSVVNGSNRFRGTFTGKIRAPIFGQSWNEVRNNRPCPKTYSVIVEIASYLSKYTVIHVHLGATGNIGSMDSLECMYSIKCIRGSKSSSNLITRPISNKLHLVWIISFMIQSLDENNPIMIVEIYYQPFSISLDF